MDDASPLVEPWLNPTYFVLLDGDRLLSYARTVWAHVSYRGIRVKVYGLGDVVTMRWCRRRGHGSVLVGAATAHIRADAQADAAILHTRHDLERLYARSGWVHAPTLRVVTDERAEGHGAPAHVMALLLSDASEALLTTSGDDVLTLPGDEW